MTGRLRAWHSEQQRREGLTEAQMGHTWQTYAARRGCTDCGVCLYECPVAAVRRGNAGAEIDPERCIGCGRCQDACPAEAIVAEGPTAPERS